MTKFYMLLSRDRIEKEEEHYEWRNEIKGRLFLRQNKLSIIIIDASKEFVGGVT